MIHPKVVVFDEDSNRVWESSRPGRVEIFAPFGAEEARAKVSFHTADAVPPAQTGYGLEISFDGVLKFRGEIAELRTRSAGFPLVIVGARRPRRMFQAEVRGVFENLSPTSILSSILALLPTPVPVYSGTPASTRIIDRLDFQGTPLFYTVDLLAKLAGNWLWRIDWDNQLVLVPPETAPEHVWLFDPDRMVLHPWLRDRPVKNLFVFHGGVVGGAEFLRVFQEAESRDRFGPVEERLFVRSISTESAYSLLRDAVLEQAPWPVNHRNIDRFDGDLSTSFGERFELRGSPLPPLDPDQVFRVAAEEILWIPQEVRVRYHLAEGLESSTRYTRYIDHDPLGTNFVAARLGPFTLDLSALDSEAHLDP